MEYKAPLKLLYKHDRMQEKNGELGEMSGRAIIHEKKTILWIKPECAAWGFTPLENTLEHLFTVRHVWATFSTDPVDVEKYLNAALGNLDEVSVVLHDGLAFIPGLNNELSKRSIPIVAYDADVDESGYEFDDDVNKVVHLIYTSIYGYFNIATVKDILGGKIKMEEMTSNYDSEEIKKHPLKKVFISYSHADHDFVHRVALDLKGLYDVWVDFIRLKAGENWENKILENIEEGDKVILFFSSVGLGKRGYFQSEIRTIGKAKDMFPEDSIFVVPVRLDECKVPRAYREHHYIDYFKIGYGDFFTKLKKSLDQD
ncbi:toll/interleukin-1 receptor domain-containing protein [Vibrio nigripulchritudo]|uniref:toll/interleukin-1 receptor domain-containing protein n=1 Tax=Vibrio nigripulchritudo TaxID=28173 RepID=UPI0003B19BCE|nr:toll/interleukin-1 receptor domain-containing protein [Vibrio nigripulchritudo]CCN70388.1 hypothetical protein VIBNISFn118_2080001 [Vibrio nigripulchritudo SFn118]